MAVRIASVNEKSKAFKKGIREGCVLLNINSHEINDFLDYNFYADENNLTVEFSDAKGKIKKVHIHKDTDEDLGLNFESFLMDKQQRCRNKCIFCFIDQLPKNMRESLYFKDDDSRLSFLFGNYVTLTNLSEHDVNRIIEMHISPVNISVHTMNRELRKKMMNNKNAGECLSIIYRLAENGIRMNTQLVLCPGVNDADELTFSLNELGKLYPAVQSIAAVPVGVTKFRDGLYDMTEYTKSTAKETIERIDAFGEKFYAENGTRLAFAADEFYLKAELPIPDESYYESYLQIENGVGLWRSLEREFSEEFDSYNGSFSVERNISLATGEAAYPLMCRFFEMMKSKFHGFNGKVYKIDNNFFGKSITVAGLITGQDLLSQLKDEELFSELLIPSVMLRSEGDMFLDNMTPKELGESLDVKITAVSNDGHELFYAILGTE